MRRGIVVYKCGSEATVLYPDGEEDVLRRRRKDAARQLCPYCQGDPTTGWELQTSQTKSGEGWADLWRYRETTPTRSEERR